MTLEKLSKTVTKTKKRVGRGYGSGKGGHTSGRGQKGQKSRGKLPLYFEGSKMRKTYIRRMPMLRGKMRFKAGKNKPLILNLKDLAGWPKVETVSVESLVKAGWIPQGAKVKLLGDGELKEKLKIDLPMSQAAAKKISKNG